MYEEVTISSCFIGILFGGQEKPYDLELYKGVTYVEHNSMVAGIIGGENGEDIPTED